MSNISDKSIELFGKFVAILAIQSMMYFLFSDEQNGRGKFVGVICAALA